MNTKRADFTHSQTREPHRERTKEILSKHPEVRQLIGKNPYTFLIICGIVGLQIVSAYLIKDQPWWAVLLLAYTIGAFANHALFVMIHECAHNLLFEKKAFNNLAGIIANLPIVVPSAISFQKYHLKHHAFQGVYELDADLPSHWEAKLIGNSWWGKALWLLFYPFFQATRPLRLRELNLWDGWSIFNLIVQLGFDVAVFVFWGPWAFIYLLASLFFSIGLHPLGARWIQRHYMVDEKGVQETYSYYGRLNTLAFNVGYHNEHHDFPSVPWNKLPDIKRSAPEAYNNLISHQSWTRLLSQWLFDRDLSLYSRVVRDERGQVKLSDEARHDLDMIKQTPAMKA